MTEELDFYIEEAKESMEKTIRHLETELSKIRAGKVYPQILDNISIEYYDVETPLKQVADINNLDNKTLIIKPWEKNTLEAIEKAVIAANIGATPQNDGDVIRLPFPPLTEERRKELVKLAKHMAEQSRVSIRNIRRDANDELKKLQKDSTISEDQSKREIDEIQKLTNRYIEEVNSELEKKEKEIMEV